MDEGVAAWQSQPKKPDRLYLAPRGCVYVGWGDRAFECGGRPVCFSGLAAPGLLGKPLPAADGGCLDLSGRRNLLAV